VTKHGNHIELFEQLTSSLTHYVQPFNDAIVDIIEQWEEQREEIDTKEKTDKRADMSKSFSQKKRTTEERRSNYKAKRQESMAFIGVVSSSKKKSHDPFASEVYAAASK
jgi:hypothetical protein